MNHPDFCKIGLSVYETESPFLIAKSELRFAETNAIPRKYHNFIVNGVNVFLMYMAVCWQQKLSSRVLQTIVVEVFSCKVPLSS